MTSLNRLLLAVLQIAQVALIVVVVVYAAKDIRKGVSHRVLLGSLVALVVLVAVTPLVTNAAVVEGMEKKMRVLERNDDFRKLMGSTRREREEDDKETTQAEAEAAVRQIDREEEIGFGL